MLYQFLEGEVIFACTFLNVNLIFWCQHVQLCIVFQHKLTLHAVTSLDLWTTQTQTTV